VTSPVSLPSGHKFTGADFDAYENLTKAWTTYTPTWTTSGTAPALGNGSTLGSYMRAGLFTAARGQITMGSTSTFGTGEFRFALPFAAASIGFDSVGAAVILDSGTTRYTASSLLGSGASYVVLVVGSVNVVTGTNPMTFANGDQISWTITYQAA
jgi:hypothetical protein